MYNFHYEDLYKSLGPEEKYIYKFLDGVPIPNMMGEHVQSLDATIMRQEIDWVITNLKADRSPRLDGLIVEFYKSFRDLITSYLKELFLYCIRSGRIPGTWKEASLTLILKDSRDGADPGSYSPISLLNTDYTILTSIMVE